jgi:hypothetical protein
MDEICRFELGEFEYYAICDSRRTAVKEIGHNKER